MFILFGSPRSGTTLFKESLNLHSEIFIPNQTTLISPIAHVIGCISDWSVARPLISKIVKSTDDFSEVLEPYISPAEIDDALLEAEPTLAGVLWQSMAALRPMRGNGWWRQNPRRSSFDPEAGTGWTPGL